MPNLNLKFFFELNASTVVDAMLLDAAIAADLVSCGGRFTSELKALVSIVVICRFSLHTFHIFVRALILLKY